MGPGPDYRAKYQALMRQHKQKEAQAVVAQWEKAQPQDPDLYVAKFNLLLGEAEVLNVSARPAAAGDFSIQNPKTGQSVGSIGGGGYDPVKLQHAMDVLRKGLALAPDRLDIRFGLAKAAEYLGDPAQQYQILKDALGWRQSAAGKPWRWRDGTALPAPEEAFVTGSLEEYMVPYWQSGTAAGYQRGLALAELLLAYYPASSLGYFNKGNYYAFTDNSAEAYKWFVQADKRNPNDPQNINNLLRISLNLKDKAAAKGYLARLCQYPDFKQDCQQYTAELQKL
jgi:tetratricopeptide (TPR) repeat protein